ncbi:4'-phosphopantetheinyl transferase family protein [Rhodovibrionaceae bacterium A322]
MQQDIEGGQTAQGGAALGLLPGAAFSAADNKHQLDRALALGPEESLLVVSLPLAGMDDQDFAQALGLITQQERERAARFHFEKDQKLYIAAHALVRQLLAWSGAGEPLELVFQPGDHGKPALIQPVAPLAFNISHCDGVVSCALARSALPGSASEGSRQDTALEVGVDVEYVARRPIDLGIAHRYFRPEEEAEILAFPPEERQRAFLSFWTLKEAIIKADGRGLTLGLDAFAFSIDAQSFVPTSLFFEPHLGEDTADWQVLRFFPGSQHLGAVAVRGKGAGASLQNQRARHLLLQGFPFM